MRIRVFISKIFFDNKAMSLLIYQTYYNDRVVRSLIQGYIKKFDVPTVVYTIIERNPFTLEYLF